MAPKLSRMSNWLRGHHAQSEITLLFRGHVTKTLYLSRYIFSLSHGPWSVTLAKDDRTPLKNLQRDAFTTLQIENVVYFFSAK